MRDISGAEFRFAKTLTLPFFGSGMVDIPSGGAKRSKNSRKMHMVFFVFYGRVQVEVGTPTKRFGIGKGGMWHVPRGTFGFLPSSGMLVLKRICTSQRGHRDYRAFFYIFASRMPRYHCGVSFRLTHEASLNLHWASPQEDSSSYLRQISTYVCGHQANPFPITGNFYSISNPGKTPARIFFAQGNEVAVGTTAAAGGGGGGDVSS